MMIEADKHTLRANALAAMHSAASLEWASVSLKSQRAKATDVSYPGQNERLRAEYTMAISVIELEIEDEMSKCHEALTKYYAQPTT